MNTEFWCEYLQSSQSMTSRQFSITITITSTFHIQSTKSLVVSQQQWISVVQDSNCVGHYTIPPYFTALCVLI
jgi:hypothetical protein